MDRQIFELVDDAHRAYPGSPIEIPTRATPGSAGYDFSIPIKAGEFVVGHNGEVIIKTDIKAKLEEGEVLMLFIRSSLGIKRNWELKNCVGIIDSDYYNNPDTGGNIMFALRSRDKFRNVLKGGERVMQGVIVNYTKDSTKPREDKRVGGVGSSGK